MGLLVDGAWQEDSAGKEFGRAARTAISSAGHRCSTITSPPTAAPARSAKAVSRRARPLSSLRFTRLPVGPSHADFPQAQKARGRDLGFDNRPAARQERLGIRHRAGRHARHRQRQADASPTSMSSAIRITPAAPACRSCGTNSSASSSTTNRPKSSACSIRRSTPSPTSAPIIIPPTCAAEIDAINDIIYPTVNNGVYRSGFSTTQAAYEEAAWALFGTLDKLEERLSRQRYPCRTADTEADWRLFTTLVRFDAVYYSHFKCNLRRIIDYPNLSNYLRDLYQVPGVAETVNLDHIKRHYYGSHRHVNPTGIVPIGPLLDFAAPHDRGRFG